MLRASRVEIAFAVWAGRIASEVFLDLKLVAACPAKDRIRITLVRRPGFSCVLRKFRVALEA